MFYLNNLHIIIIYLFILFFLFYSTEYDLPKTPNYEPSVEKTTIYVSPNVRKTVESGGPQFLPPFSSLMPMQTSTPQQPQQQQQFGENSALEQMVKNLFEGYMSKHKKTSTYLPPPSPLKLPTLPPLPPLPTPPAPPSDCSSTKRSGRHDKCKTFSFYLNYTYEYFI